jgi:regulator of sigma E protease
MSFFVAILGLGFLVLIHEAGHFFTARAVGMSPRRFYIGFPPALVKTTRKGIEYGIGSIPLGGYVKIPGMHRPAPSDADLYLGRAASEAPELVAPLNRLKRRLEAGELEQARDELADVSAVVASAKLSPQARALAERGLRELADGLGRDAYWRQRTWRRVAVIFAGPGTNLVLAVVLFAVVFMLGGGKPTTTVDQVIPGRPAAAAGLRSGDRVLAIDHRRIRQPSDILRLISGSRGRPLTLTVVRDGQVVMLGPVRPKIDQGAYKLGFVLRGKGLSPPQAAWSSIKLTGIVTREIGKSLGRLVHGQGREDVSSPVGIVQSSSAAARAGLQNYLWVLGLLSLSLALLNLLPLLPLDGGHIVFSIIEGLRGRSVGRAVYERVSAVGIALVLLLFFIGLSNDIGRLGGG